jgi:hypothetical protein
VPACCGSVPDERLQIGSQSQRIICRGIELVGTPDLKEQDIARIGAAKPGGLRAPSSAPWGLEPDDTAAYADPLDHAEARP